jgi:hypothetical protein
MSLKTCRKCGQAKPRDAENFRTERRKRDDGSDFTLITSPCRKCMLGQRRQYRQDNLADLRDGVRRAVAASRAAKGRPSRADEYRRKADKAAQAAGFACAEARRAVLERKAALNRLLEALKLALRRKRVAEGVCWLWDNPTLGSGESWKLRYAIDPEFRGRQLVRFKSRKAHIERATPPWVDRKALAAVYAGRPAGHHVDHFVPLKGRTSDGAHVSGLHVPWNLRYLPGDENIGRSNRMTAKETAQAEAASSSQVCTPFALGQNPRP